MIRFAMVVLLAHNFLWPTASLAEPPAFRLRWHQVQFKNFSNEDIQTEVRFGREVAARILANMDIKNNDAMNRYLNLIGQSLVIHGSRNELQFHFTLLDSPDIGAYSTPGGYVFVTQGLLDIIENEAELAAVLAHEIGHINLRHIVNDLNIRAVSKEELSNVARFLGASGDTTRAVVNQAVDKAYEVLFRNGFKKNQELQADATAIQMLAVTGYDPAALSSILQRIALMNLSNNSKTHPQFSSRSAHMEKLTAEFSAQSHLFNKAALRFQEYSGRSDEP